MRKTCSKCGQTKDSSEFRPRRDVRGGLRAQCKACMNMAERVTRERREAERR